MRSLESFFSELKNIKVINPSIPITQYTAIDLSITNSKLSEINLKEPIEFEKFIENHLLMNNSKIAVGGYNETRNLYKHNQIFTDNKNNERNIHLGIDFWTKAETAVLAALDGIVYGFADNTGAGNYGPTIVLKHSLENYCFYTLYGHLSLKSIAAIEIGMHFKKGQQLATIGDSRVNGEYPPHLHFQVIKNIEKNTNDYPGVCTRENALYYLENCPDPNLMLKIF